MKGRALVTQTEIKLATDMEGGRVQRSVTGSVLLLSAMFNRTDSAISTAAVKKFYSIQGLEDVVCTLDDGKV